MQVKVAVAKKSHQGNMVNLGAQAPPIQRVQDPIRPDRGQDLDRHIVVETKIGPGLNKALLQMKVYLIFCMQKY